MRHARRQQMAQDAARHKKMTPKRSGALLHGIAAFCFAAALGIGIYQLFVHPDTPLPRQWNPTKALVISDPVTPLSQWKLSRAAADFDQCLSVLDGAASVGRMVPLVASDQCYINDRVSLAGVGETAIDPLETRCAIALRLAMWERHSVQPAAKEAFGTGVATIRQIGSYNCRGMRTSSGPSTRMSTHATADAIDITGFDLDDGTKIRLLEDWEGRDARSEFLRRVRDGACDWFDLTLSPDYNRLHADHFHLQSRGWGLCR